MQVSPLTPPSLWQMSAVCFSDSSAFDNRIGRPFREGRIVSLEDKTRGVDSLPGAEQWIQASSAERLRSARASILLVTNVFDPVPGGISVYVRRLFAALTSRGLRCRVIAYPPLLVEREARRPHSPFRKLFHVAFLGRVLAAVVAERLRGYRVVVHSHSASYCLTAAWLARWLGARSVHTFHSPLGYRSRLLEWLVPRLDAVLTVSSKTWQLYQRLSNVQNDRVALVPGCASCSPRRIEDGERAKIRDSLRASGVVPFERYALFVGRLTPDKGVHLAIEAMTKVPSMPQSFGLVVVGPSPPSPAASAYRSELEDQSTAAGLNSRIRFAGYVPEERLHDFFTGADVLIVPSIWEEPAPLVLVEALACGTPVIGTKVGGLPELIRDRVSGFLIPPETPSEIARCLSEILENPNLLRHLREGALRESKQRFNPDRWASKHVDIYFSVL